MSPYNAWRILAHREGHANTSEPLLRATLSSSDTWLVNKLRLERVLSGHEGCVNSSSFTPDGQYLITGSDDVQVICWDWQTGRIVWNHSSGHHNNVFQTKPMPHTNNQTIVTCAADGEVRLLQLTESGDLDSTRRLARHRGWAHKISILPDQPQCFVSSGADGYVLLFDLRVPYGRRRSETGTAATSTGSDRCHVAMMRVSAWESNSRWLEVNAVHHNPSRPWLLAVGGDDCVARVYDTRAWRDTPSRNALTLPQVSTLYPNHMSDYLGGVRTRFSPHITSLVYAHNGELLVTYGNEDIYLFDSAGASGQQHTVRSPPLAPSPMASSPPPVTGHKRKAAPGSTDPSAEQESTATNPRAASTCTTSLHQTDGDAQQQDAHKDVEPGSSRPARDDHVIQKYTGHRNQRTVKSVNFLGEDEQWVVSGSDCGHVFIWQRQGGRLHRVMEGDSEVVNVLEPHPWQPMVMATSGIDDTVKIWSPATAHDSRCSAMVVEGADVDRLLSRNSRGSGADRDGLRAAQWAALREEQLLRHIRNVMRRRVAVLEDERHHTAGQGGATSGGSHGAEEEDEVAEDMRHVVHGQIARDAAAHPGGAAFTLLRILFGGDGSPEDSDEVDGEDEEEESEGDSGDEDEGSESGDGSISEEGDSEGPQWGEGSADQGPSGQQAGGEAAEEMEDDV